MADFVYDTSTPCPLRPRIARAANHEGGSLPKNMCGNELGSFDETRNLEFTTEIRPPVLTGVKPKRRNNKGVPSFHIHEDDDNIKAKKDCVDDNHKSMNGTTMAVLNRKSSLLAQPAQRFRPKACFAPNTSSRDRQPQSEPGNANIKENKISIGQLGGRDQEVPPKDIYKKAVRRNTVYIPPDDTTVPSVFMGLFSPLKSQSITDYQVSEDTQVNSLEAQIARKKLAKKSSLAFPRRAPLQTSSTVAQENANHIDMPGKNGGKENIPPGGFIGYGGKKCRPEELHVLDGALSNDGCKSDRVWSAPRPRAHLNKAPIANKTPAVRASSAKRTVLKNNRQSKASPLTTGTSTKGNNSLKRNPVTKEKTLPSNRSSTPCTLSNITIPNLARRSLNDKYPLLTEDISNPSMYEDNWLTHQEIGITQLVNGLFDFAHSGSSSPNPNTLRHELLGMYQTSDFTQLHRRLQASLLYGSLSVPKDIIAQNNRMKQDVGLKRRFLDNWLQVYDLPSLRAAAETVLGRQITLQTNGRIGSSPTERNQSEEKILKKEMEAFLDTFLLLNEDMDYQAAAEPKGVFAEVASWEYVRTVLRSVMIIVLLDTARLNNGTALPRRLFVPSSPYKSSAAVLQALGRLLLPSSGIITRPLGQLGCHVYYEQHKLQEYEYKIDNLAVDLRDGVRLARVVEMLLYPSTSGLNGDGSDYLDGCTMLTVSDEQTVSVSNKEGNWPLSEHLKFPCPSRAAKLFNVQISLEALSSTNSAGIVDNINAEDIVDGHREKTIALLWGLVSKWGLVGLVDWDDLRREIERLKRKAVSLAGATGSGEILKRDWFHGEDHIDVEEPVEQQQEQQHVCLLRRWASILAELGGLRLTNLTTSFADGKIYESIVNEYEGYILEDAKCGGSSNLKSVDGSPLWARLQALGCSSQFAYLVSPTTSTSAHIFNGDFTLTSLAFLSSRLLSASKGPRAATVLQRVWRRILTRRDLQRRTVARDLATQCAAVVQMKERIVWAKEVIWRGWREWKQQRLGRGRE